MFTLRNQSYSMVHEYANRRYSLCTYLFGLGCIDALHMAVTYFMTLLLP